jgi:predicted dienelactone hydrolase
MRRCFAWAALLTSLASATAGVAQRVPRLPEPAGPFGVGRLSFEWTDEKRPNPFLTERNERRRLMVYIWYPTASDQKGNTGTYVPGAKEIDAVAGFDRARAGPIWPLIVSGVIKSHAQDDVPVAKSPARFPVVLFSHGNGGSSFIYTSAIEDLVSHGYIVAAVEHPYSSSAVVFPDGQVIVYADRQTLNGDRPSGVPYFEGVELAMRDMRQVNGIQAADLRFALDQLTLLDTSRNSPLEGRLDLTRVAAIGHSLGGMSAVRACQQDARIRACANLDGGTPDGVFLHYPDSAPLEQPLLYVEAAGTPTFSDQQLADRGITRAAWTASVTRVADTQERQLREVRSGSYKVQLRAPGMNHGSFGDTSLSATTPEAERRALHNLGLTIEVTRAFLDKHVKGLTTSLLDLGSARNSEITVTRYGALSR